MIDRTVWTKRLRRLARAAAGAFREDPVFRYAVLGALAALLMLASRLSGPAGRVPSPPAPPTALGSTFADPPAPQGAAAAGNGPIAPGSALNSAVVQPDGQGEPDRFGRVGPPSSAKRSSE